MRFIFVLIFFVVASIADDTVVKLDELTKRTNRYLYTEKKEISVNKVDTGFHLYHAYAYLTIDASFEKAAQLLMDYDNFENVFEKLVDVRYLKDARWPKRSLYYIEGKTRMVHAWGVGELYSEQYYPDSLLRVEVRPAPRYLFKEFQREIGDSIKYHVKRVYLDLVLLKVNEEQCRVGFRGMSATNRRVPLWLATMIMKVVLPNLLEDLEKKAGES